MVTEVFYIKHGDETAYLHLDRTYKYGGIMLLSDLLNKVCMGGIDGYTYFCEFSLEKWLNQLSLTDGVVTLEVAKDCDGMINYSVYKDKCDDILSIVISDSVVEEIRNSKNEVIYSKGDDEIKDFEVGWFGKVFDYYTNNISHDIDHFSDRFWYSDEIWGVYYPTN